MSEQAVYANQGCRGCILLRGPNHRCLHSDQALL